MRTLARFIGLSIVVIVGFLITLWLFTSLIYPGNYWGQPLWAQIGGWFNPTIVVVDKDTSEEQSAPAKIAPQPAPAQPAAPASALVDPYRQTEKGQTRTWTIEVPQSVVAIIGGYEVDNVANGVYKAVQGPTTLSVTVKDGFVRLADINEARQEFCFRLAQAVEQGWAHQVVSPLPGWSSCW